MRKFTVGSVFSGVAGLCGGFQDEGFEIAWQVEIEDAARGVLDHLYPGVQKFKDIRDVRRHNLCPVDVLVGGFPCTDLSVAGARVGIGGKSSGLFWEMMRVAEELQVQWIVWENVPGLLSSFSPCEDPPEPVEGREWEVEESSDFETVLRGLAERGYSGAWRILDAQLFGIPQRRERLFGVFTRLPAGAERAAEVLALRESLLGNPPKGRKAKKDVAAPLTGGTPGSGPGCGEDAASGHLVVGTLQGGSGNRGYRIGAEDAASLVAFGRNNTSGPDGTAGALMGQCGGRGDFETETFIIQCHGSNVGPMGTLRRGSGNHTSSVPVFVSAITSSATGADDNDAQAGHLIVFPAAGVTDTLQATIGGTTVANLGRVVCVRGDVTHTLTHEGADASEDGTGRGTPIVAFGCKDSDPCGKGNPAASPTLRSRGEVAIATEYIVRRLLPIECERLMNWPDGTTQFKVKNGRVAAQADAPRYQQIGNGVVKACARYVARRLKKVMEAL